MAISGSHGSEVGRTGRHLVAEALLDDRVGIVASEVHELAQELAPDRVRRRRGVRLAYRVLLAQPGRFLAQRFEQAGLAHAGFPDDLDQASRARPRARASASRIAASSASRPINGSCCSDSCRVREPLARPSDHA